MTTFKRGDYHKKIWEVESTLQQGKLEIAREFFPIGTRLYPQYIRLGSLGDVYVVTGHSQQEWWNEEVFLEYKKLDRLGRPNGPTQSKEAAWFDGEGWAVEGIGR